MNISCCINNCVINHLIDADDLVLFSPSAKGLQKLIDIVHNGADNDIKFNKTHSLFQISNLKTYIFTLILSYAL